MFKRIIYLMLITFFSVALSACSGASAGGDGAGDGAGGSTGAGSDGGGGGNTPPTNANTDWGQVVWGQDDWS